MRNDKRGFVWFLAIPLIILGIILIGVGVFYFQKLIDFFTSSYFLIGIGVILGIIFFKFVLAFLMNVIMPLATMVIRAVQRILYAILGAI